MDFASFYGLVTIIGLLGFLRIVAWVFSESNRDRFRQAALIPMNERELPSDRRNSWVRHY